MVSTADIAFWTAVGTWALVAGTLIISYWQTRQNQQLNSANAVMTLRERFDSNRMRTARRHIAERLIKGVPEDIANLEVATFFELVGTLVHRRVLDESLVWEAFGSWVEAYWWALRNPVDLIGRIRDDMKDPLIFHEFEWLRDRVALLDAKMMGHVAASRVEEVEGARRMLHRESLLESV